MKKLFVLVMCLCVSGVCYAQEPTRLEQLNSVYLTTLTKISQDEQQKQRIYRSLPDQTENLLILKGRISERALANQQIQKLEKEIQKLEKLLSKEINEKTTN